MKSAFGGSGRVGACWTGNSIRLWPEQLITNWENVGREAVGLQKVVKLLVDSGAIGKSTKNNTQKKSKNHYKKL